MFDLLDGMTVFSPLSSMTIDASPEPAPPAFRPRMTMVPFSLTMYPDDILLFRHDADTDDEGDSRRTFPAPGEPFYADVQSKREARKLADGREQIVSTHDVRTPDNINAKPDDEIRWEGRKLTVEVHTIGIGTGDIAWKTMCVETK